MLALENWTDYFVRMLPKIMFFIDVWSISCLIHAEKEIMHYDKSWLTGFNTWHCTVWELYVAQKDKEIVLYKMNVKRNRYGCGGYFRVENFLRS